MYFTVAHSPFLFVSRRDEDEAARLKGMVIVQKQRWGKTKFYFTREADVPVDVY